MTSVTSARSSASSAAAKPPAKGITAADAATARGLKPAINALMMRVRVGLTPVAQQPKLDAKSGLFRAPSGKLLFPVALETPPKGGRDMFSRSALVDPTTNTFYVHTTGGFAGVSTFNGPLGLPAEVQFKGKSASTAQLKLLQAAAAKPAKAPAFHASPTLQRASYSIGMGMRPPEGVYAGPKVDLTVTFPNITYTPVWSVKTDEKNKTLTVVIDASSGNPQSRAMTRPVELSIPVQRPAAAGATYTLLIKDHAGKVLSRSKFTNALPM